MPQDDVVTAERIVLISAPEVRAIAVHDNEEPLVDLSRLHRVRIDTRKRDDTGEWHRARERVAAKLQAAARGLPNGLELVIVEAYRPVGRQQRFFDNYASRLLAEDPDLRADRLEELASRFVAPPECAPHTSGGAVDITIGTVQGGELDLGCPVDETPEDSSGACYTAADIPAAARQNRNLLSKLLTDQGSVNYPTEWWHWSYGDRYWALFTSGAEHAVYDAI